MFTHRVYEGITGTYSDVFIYAGNGRRWFSKRISGPTDAGPLTAIAGLLVSKNEAGLPDQLTRLGYNEVIS